MGDDWKRPPTPAEAMAFKLNAEATLLAKWWPLLAAARQEDIDRKPGDRTVGPAGRFAGEIETYPVSATEAAAIKAAGAAARPVSAP
jgi:hypothetical protein